MEQPTPPPPPPPVTPGQWIQKLNGGAYPHRADALRAASNSATYHRWTNEERESVRAAVMAFFGDAPEEGSSTKTQKRAPPQPPPLAPPVQPIPAAPGLGLSYLRLAYDITQQSLAETPGVPGSAADVCKELRELGLRLCRAEVVALEKLYLPGK